MIGQAKFDFKTKDLIQLVKKELVEKLGNRELAPYDMSVPGVIKTKAKVSVYPDPLVHETTVEEQIKQLNPVTKPQVARSQGTLTLAEIGGDEILFKFDRETNKATIYGGVIKYTPAGESGQTVGGHWVGVNVGFPLGITFEEGQILPYTHNGVPAFVVIDAGIVENKAVTIYMDGAETTHALKFNWSSDYEPEKIMVEVTAPLEDPAVKKIPAYPTTSKFEFEFPSSDDYIDADIEVTVDLEVGK